MTISMHRSIPFLFTLAALASTGALAADHPSNKYAFDLAPSAELHYAIKAKQNGLSISGNAVLTWYAADNRFAATTETRAMLVGKILDEKSEGAIDDFGLAPATFTEKRFRKAQTVTSFDRDKATIRFSASEQAYALKGGEQDRASAIWQLVAVARGAGARFKPGSGWTFFVAGPKDAEAWNFKVVKQETVRTPLGELAALRVTKTPRSGSRGQQLDIWLAPSLEWYPIRLRFSEPDGEYIEQTLDSVVRK